ncbi:MAG: T9SS type A sorting domain-containing protein [Flavobacteriales bacterium]|nr:T9SS type A sorting domain-containing protein [Flavobacteriales bacterium]
MPTAGVKLYSTSPSGLTIFNLDLSVYANIPYPPLPDGYVYFDVLYITESTFDTDPLSIELMMLTQSPSFGSGTRIFRDDGTILLDELGYGFSGTGGYDDVNAKPPLFADENGVAHLVLSTYPTTPPTSSKLLQLPGQVPCMDCATGSGVGIQPGGTVMDQGSLTIFPNPTSELLTVDVLLPVGVHAGRLLVHDAVGKLVANLSVQGSGQLEVSVTGRASGIYTCVLIADGERRQAEQFVVER